MNFKNWWFPFVCLVLTGAMVFYVFQSTVSGGFLNMALEPVHSRLEASMEDQRKLSKLDPENTAIYRERFEEIRKLRENYLILEHNREMISRRVEQLLVGLLLLILLTTGVLYFILGRKQEQRLLRLQGYLEDLSAGETDIRVPDKGRDVLGRIGRMIEETSGVIARQRKRLSNMDSLSAWQEAARRHAHEIRTPLTAARMELNLMVSFVLKRSPELEDRVRQLQGSVNEELDHLKDFTHSFTSFAKIGKPKLKDTSIYEMLEKYCDLFKDAWENLELKLAHGGENIKIDMDKDMVRQVLVNLCNNSSLALDQNPGVVEMSLFQEGETFVISVRDNGPGIAPEIGANLFKPYTTSRKIGEGMGLGLAISKKIMLDHGGDLILASSSEQGTCFHLIFDPYNMEAETHG